MAPPVDINIAPLSKGKRTRARVAELSEGNPALAMRVTSLLGFIHELRTALLTITNLCNLRCDGCWFFGQGMDKDSHELRDLDEVRAHARRLRKGGVTHVLLLGGEPGLALDKVRVLAQEIPFVTVVTNGTIEIPLEGLENINVAVSLWGGLPIDDALRGHNPKGKTLTGLAEKAFGFYKDDPRAIFIYTVSESGIEYVEETVRRIIENGNIVNPAFYSSYDPKDRRMDPAVGEHLIDELVRVKGLYPDGVVGQRTYYETLVRRQAPWGDRWGYDVCPSISVDYPDNAARLKNGNPYLTGFNAYRADNSVQMCCTSGACGECADSQAIWSWLLVSLDRFVDSVEHLELWASLAEDFLSQFYWSPYHPQRRRAAPAAE